VADAIPPEAKSQEPLEQALDRQGLSVELRATPTATVSIKWNETHQVIDGFGGAQPAAAAALLANWPAPERSQILDLAFSEVNGIGLTILRTEILPELETYPGAWNYSDDAQVYIMKQAVARGPVKIMGSVWSPPGWMKDNGSTISGFIDTDHFPQYADYLSHYASQYASANGVNIYAVSIQNEPETDGVPWRTCRWDNHQIANFLANHLGPTFASNNIGTKVIAPETANWDHVEYDVSDGSLPFMYWTYGNPAALARVDIVAGHTYGGNLSRPFQQALDAGKRIWQTEASPGGVEPEGQTTRDIDGALKWTKQIHDGLAGAQASAWLWFILATYPEGTLIELSGDGHSFAPNKTFWALGNFSKFIRPGFVRIGAIITSSTDPSYTSAYLSTSAYKNPTTGQLVIVAINRGSSAARVKFQSGFPVTATPYVTSTGVQNLEPQPDVSLGDLVTIPGKSIVTFVSQPGLEHIYLSPGFPTFGSTIAAARNSDGRLEFFGVDGATNVFHNPQTSPGGSMLSWLQMDGLLNVVAAETNSDGRMELFGVTSSMTIFHRAQTSPSSSTWSPWSQLDGLLTSIAVARNANGRLEVFGTTSSQTIFHRYQIVAGSNTWSQWEQLDGLLVQVAAERNLDGRLELFGVTASGTIFHRWQMAPNTNSWSPWSQLDGLLTSIAVARNADGRLEIFGNTSSGTIFHRYQIVRGSNTWSAWSQLDGLVNQVAAEANADGRIELIGVTWWGTVFRRFQVAPNSASWSAWTQL
jgi:O-glycosyl hydrolase